LSGKEFSRRKDSKLPQKRLLGRWAGQGGMNHIEYPLEERQYLGKLILRLMLQSLLRAPLTRCRYQPGKVRRGAAPPSLLFNSRTLRPFWVFLRPLPSLRGRVLFSLDAPGGGGGHAFPWRRSGGHWGLRSCIGYMVTFGVLALGPGNKTPCEKRGTNRNNHFQRKKYNLPATYFIHSGPLGSGIPPTCPTKR